MPLYLPPLGTATASNTALGVNSLQSNTIGAQNTALGVNSLQSNTIGAYNTALGVNSLYSNTIGTYNTALGGYSLGLNTIGAQNTALGVNSLQSNVTGASNTALGVNSLGSNTIGAQNTALGVGAGRYIADGTTPNATSATSVYLGFGTEALADGDANEIVIGYSAVGLGSNTAVLGNSSIAKTQLYGGVGFWGHAPQASLPGAPVTLSDVIAIIRGCGLSA